MKRTEIEEGLGELADIAERDHEVQMARAQLYKIAKYSIKLHDMLKAVSEAEGLEGWIQSKITKSSEMIGSVYHHLDYEQVAPMANEHHDKPEEHEEVKEVKEKTYKDTLHAKLEGMKKFKSAAHRKAVHAGKASGKRKK